MKIQLLALSAMGLAFSAFAGQTVSICDKGVVAAAILKQLGTSSCASISQSALANISKLDLSDQELYDIDIPANAFQGLDNLSTLDLSANRLKSVPANIFQGLIHLSTLNLSSNGITTISSDGFAGLENLSELDLSYNDLTALSSAQFQSLKNLSKLSLYENQITTISADAFQGHCQ